MGKNEIITNNQTRILAYTRKPNNDYTKSLSNSIHFAISETENDFKPLNQNYGILFATATISDENTIVEKGIKNPFIFKTADESYGILAVRVDANGCDDEESRGEVLLWTTKDFITFIEHGLIRLHNKSYINKAICKFNVSNATYEFHWKDNEGNYYVTKRHTIEKTEEIESSEGFNVDDTNNYIINTINGNIVDIDVSIYDKLKTYWNPISNIKIQVPKSIVFSSVEELKKIKAEAIYSDGSMAYKDITWDLSSVELTKPGIFTINGRVTEETYQFPLAKGYADPVMLYHNEKYYFISTNDNKNDIGIYVREADSIHGLFTIPYKESIILNVDEEKDFIQTFWAPEFHYIGGELYILFAIGGKAWSPQCHMMKLKRNGNIMNPNDYETPIRVKKADGSNLTDDGITLDMTYFKADNVSYLVWSYRKGIGTKKDTGSMLYIARTDENNPYVLTSEPVLLSRPLYGWENIQGTINNEGPYALVTNDTVYITYSGGAAGGYTYALGLLSIPIGSDCLNVSKWKKASTPVLSYYSIDKIYGPGHNSFFKDKNGDIMILYHAEQELTKAGERCSAMHRVHTDIEGRPVFNMSWERDLNKELVNVSTKLIID